MNELKQALKKVLPQYMIDFYRRRNWQENKFKGLSAQQIFTQIYNEGAWGSPSDQERRFSSGSGSRDEAVVTAYVEAVRPILASFDRKPDVVDLGCGDFSVGSKLRSLCNRYIACDIVAPLIEENRARFAESDVEFRVLDASVDELPPGDVVFIRQVLQHLSNRQIKDCLANISGRYRFLILTDHLPISDAFRPNLDKPTGPGTRLSLNSGVEITRPPFNFEVRSQKRLCDIRALCGVYDGIIRTTSYEFV